MARENKGKWYITIDFFSEPNHKGNCNRYYYGGKKKNGEPILTGTDNRKEYTIGHYAVLASKWLHQKYGKDARVCEHHTTSPLMYFEWIDGRLTTIK